MAKSKNEKIIDATTFAYTQYGVGVVRGNPKRCLHCRRAIRKGEAWTKQTAAPDSQFGT